MSDTPTLKEALATPLQWLEVEYPTLSPVLAAARAYEAGQDIWWCEIHNSKAFPEEREWCETWEFVASSSIELPECRMVLMRLSPVVET